MVYYGGNAGLPGVENSRQEKTTVQADEPDCRVMTDETNQSTDLELTGHKASRPRRGVAAASCAAVVILVLCAVSYELVSNSRYTVIGITDPATGYFIEYTVSSRYRMTHEAPPTIVREFGEVNTFTPNPAPMAIQWITTHIFRKPASPSDMAFSGWGPCCYQGDSAVGMTTDVHGYPDMPSVNQHRAGLVHEHMLVHGGRATLYTYGFPQTANRNTLHYSLLVKPEDRNVFYGFVADEDIAKPIGVLNEMMKIKDSIRISKVR